MIKRKHKHLLEGIPPFTERLARAMAYLFFTGGAIWAVTGELPRSLDNITQPWQLSVFSLFLGFSIIASVASLRGRYKTEYAVLPWSIGAIAIYETGLIYTVASGDNYGSGLATFIIAGLIMHMLARFINLHQLVTGPQRLDQIKAEIEEIQKERAQLREEISDGR